MNKKTLIPTRKNTHPNHHSNNNAETRRVAAIMQVQREYFAGPLPHPDLLQKYEQACPGAANRIIKMAESQSGHRQKIESKVIDSNISNEKSGMNYAFALTFVFMIIGGILLLNDKQVAGYFSLFGPSIFHAGNYTYKKYIEKEEPRKKEREIEDAKKKKTKK